MGIVAATVKAFTGDEYVSTAVSDFRKSICNSCTYQKNGYCGKPIIGNWVNHNGNVVKLCGCITDEKALLKQQSCPANKW